MVALDLNRRSFLTGMLAGPVAAAAAAWGQEGEVSETPAFELPLIPPPDPRAVRVPDGFQADLVAYDLTYPTSVEIDDAGNLLIAESGFFWGDEIAPARVRLLAPGSDRFETLLDQLNGPVTDLLWVRDRLFISHRGKISALVRGELRDVVTGLPSLGDHQNNALSYGPDGKLYFGQGTATNSGVVGPDNFAMGWLARHPEFHDHPAGQITLRGQQFESLNPLALRTAAPAMVATSAFVPFGNVAYEGMVVGGSNKANGTVLRVNPDGTDLEVVAWGLRNPLGVGWSPDHTLYATDLGFDERGSRPIANAPDALWRIRAGAWYGWPDFAAGQPVTQPQFQRRGRPSLEFVLAAHPPIERPLLGFRPHTGTAKFDFSRRPAFGRDQMYLALMGDLVPLTGEKADHSSHRVVRVDLRTMEVHPFFYSPGYVGERGLQYVATPGLRRPIDVVFAPRGEAMYVVDLGAAVVLNTAAGPIPRPFPATGAVWRITPRRRTIARRP
jgi:glucose/arabinose dehydrogenase